MDNKKISFQRGIPAPDGIHEAGAIVINEWRPKGGWLKHYRDKNSDLKDKLLVCAIFALYLAGSTLDYYWG